jgi:hypothetical protein
MAKTFHPIPRPYSWRQLTPAEQEISRDECWRQDAQARKRSEKIIAWIATIVFVAFIVGAAFWLGGCMKNLYCPTDRVLLRTVSPQIGAVDHLVCPCCWEVYVLEDPAAPWPLSEHPLVPCEERRHIQLARVLSYNRPQALAPAVNGRVPQELNA